MGHTPWYVTPVTDIDIHVHPVHDLIDHDPDVDCFCLPDVETVERDNGEVVFISRHHNLDAREA